MSGGLRFKVKPRKSLHVVTCAPELSTLLACFASSGDLKGSEACAQAAKGLHHCMAMSKKPVKTPKSSINYLLRKVN
ncbi:hypothetical protein DB88DRAFT_542736 [Papiliotrema laurentii]|uniref:CHCH domain-containing protein n=1 Tax=Papiliotrema laurentii TaxID=5418 RepID=A0AAD9FPL8_PAPLA|nr:hypothetical protein DB88DRAFT_458882 [Papiliotrema laurentii]KAK1921172.1 hypothetical protein DB88DRAFT_542736 [Papiliotrema laurentii]